MAEFSFCSCSIRLSGRSQQGRGDKEGRWRVWPCFGIRSEIALCSPQSETRINRAQPCFDLFSMYSLSSAQAFDIRPIRFPPWPTPRTRPTTFQLHDTARNHPLRSLLNAQCTVSPLPEHYPFDRSSVSDFGDDLFPLIVQDNIVCSVSVSKGL